MKILVLSQYFYPENFRINSLCNDLVRRGHDVTVLTGYPQYPQGEIYPGYGFDIPYEREWNGVHIERVKMSPRGKNVLNMVWNCISYVIEANKWISRCGEKFDIVYVFELSPVTVGLPAVKYKKKFGTPILFNVQDLWPENVQVVLGINNPVIIGVINHIVDTIYKNSSKILCTSQSFVESVVSRGIEREKVLCWHQFCDMPEKDKLVRPDVYSKDEFNVVFTGNIGEAQGLDLLIDSAEQLKFENIHWYLVGDGRARKRLEEKVIEKNISDQVTFMGKVSEHKANEYVFYADCAYLSFAKSELLDKTIPAKLQTYLACGTPILAAAGGESADIINKGKCGFAVEREKDSVCDALKDLIELKRIGKIEEIKKNCIKYFESHFIKEKLMDELEKIMNEEVCRYENNAN